MQCTLNRLNVAFLMNGYADSINHSYRFYLRSNYLWYYQPSQSQPCL